MYGKGKIGVAAASRSTITCLAVSFAFVCGVLFDRLVMTRSKLEAAVDTTLSNPAAQAPLPAPATLALQDGHSGWSKATWHLRADHWCTAEWDSDWAKHTNEPVETCKEECDISPSCVAITVGTNRHGTNNCVLCSSLGLQSITDDKWDTYTMSKAPAATAAAAPALLPASAAAKSNDLLCKTWSGAEVHGKDEQHPCRFGKYVKRWTLGGNLDPPRVCLREYQDFVSDVVGDQGRWPDCSMNAFLWTKTAISSFEASCSTFAPCGAKGVKKLFVDVGGNIGTCTLEMLARPDVERVVTFEPNPKNLFYLTNSVMMNPGYAERLKLFPMPLGSEVGSHRIFMTPNNAGNTVLDAQVMGDELDQGVTVTTTTLDNVFFQRGKPPYIHVMKMDAQGYEVKILKGGRRLLASGAINSLVLEVAPSHLGAQGTSSAEMFNIIIQNGYDIFRGGDFDENEKLPSPLSYQELVRIACKMEGGEFMAIKAQEVNSAQKLKQYSHRQIDCAEAGPPAGVVGKNPLCPLMWAGKEVHGSDEKHKCRIAPFSKHWTLGGGVPPSVCLREYGDFVSNVVGEQGRWPDCSMNAFLWTKTTPSAYEAQGSHLTPCGANGVEKLFVDVGGNIGACTMAMLARQDVEQVVTFEPNPKNLFYLTSSVLQNQDYAKRLQLFPMPLGQEVGSHRIYMTPNNAGNTVLDAKVMGDELDQGVDVTTTTLDDVFVRGGKPPYIHVMKMDAQGYEVKILKGGRRLLASGAINSFVLELAPSHLHSQGSSSAEFLNMFLANGYDILQGGDFAESAELPDPLSFAELVRIACETDGGEFMAIYNPSLQAQLRYKQIRCKR